MTVASLRCLLLALATALCASTVVAQPAADTTEARMAAAEQLVRTLDDILGPEKLMQSMRNAMQAPLADGLRNHPSLSEAQKRRAAQVLGDELGAVMGDMMSAVKPSLHGTMIKIYAERFNLAELQELQTLYANPSLRKATLLSNEELPRLMQPMMVEMQQWQPRILARVNAAVTRLKAEGIDLQTRTR
jgi:hypothetical protein